MLNKMQVDRDTEIIDEDTEMRNGDTGMKNGDTEVIDRDTYIIYTMDTEMPTFTKWLSKSKYRD